MKTTVAALKEQGYHVSVEHRRLYPAQQGIAAHYGLDPEATDKPISKRIAHDCGYDVTQPLPRGGETVAYVSYVDPDGVELLHMGIATCSPKDTYNKKLGAAIALGRAMTPVREGG